MTPESPSSLTGRTAGDAALAAQSRLELAIEGSGTGIWDRDIVTGQIHYSPGWKAILGYAANELSDRIEDGYTRVHPDDLAYVQAAMQAHFDQITDSYAVEHRIRCRDGSYKWISSRGKVISRDAGGKALRMTGTTTDISAMQAMSDRLQQSVDLITSLTNEIPGLVYQYCTGVDGVARYTYASEGIRDIYEITPAQAIRNIALIEAVIHPDDLSLYRESLATAAANLTPWHLEYRVLLPRQGLRWRTGDARGRRLADGSTQWHGFITDITERKHIEAELREFATIDFLTRLPNRRHFMTRMEEELARISRGQVEATVLMCDLDYFKKINDTHGHATGDLVLRHFSKLLASELRKSDIAGRVGGEEFAVLLPGADLRDAMLFAERIQKKMADSPVEAGSTVIAVTVSIGIALMTARDATADAVLSRSDSALYRAKVHGRDRIELARD